LIFEFALGAAFFTLGDGATEVKFSVGSIFGRNRSIVVSIFSLFDG
jgi:hypothetical protein